MKKFILACLLFSSVKVHSQMKVEGEYYLVGVMETASGFRFNSDSTFDFFFSQGAVDRAGSGKWKQMGNQLLLNGPQRKERDFVMIKSESNKSDAVTIKITDPNEMVLRYVLCNIETDTGIVQEQTDESGIITIPRQPVSDISLIHLLWPDRWSHFSIQDKNNNEFVFTIDHDIVNVYFENLSLTITENGLIGRHPLLKGDQFNYEK